MVKIISKYYIKIIDFINILIKTIYCLTYDKNNKGIEYIHC